MSSHDLSRLKRRESFAQRRFGYIHSICVERSIIEIMVIFVKQNRNNYDDKSVSAEPPNSTRIILADNTMSSWEIELTDAIFRIISFIADFQLIPMTPTLEFGIRIPCGGRDRIFFCNRRFAHRSQNEHWTKYATSLQLGLDEKHDLGRRPTEVQ